MRTAFLKYEADPEAVSTGGATAAPPPPASDEVAPSDGVVDVDWGAVTEGVPGNDEPPATTSPDSGEPATAPAAATPPPSPAVPPAAAVTPPPSSPPPPPAQPTQTPEQVAAERLAAEKNIRAALEQHYQKSLSEDDARELAINPEKVIPRLLAQATFDAVTTMQGMWAQQAPHLVAQVATQETAKAKAMTDFFSVNTDLAKPEYKTVLDAAAQAYRTAHPNAKRDEAIRGVGRTARAMLGIPEPAAETASAPPPPAPTTRPAAFIPAATGGASPRTPVAKAPTPWDELIEPD